MGVKDQTISQTESQLGEDTTGEGTSEVDHSSVVEDDRGPEAPSLDIIFEILKNSRRREVIKYLRDADDRVPLGELAEHVAAIENGISVAELSSSQRKRVYVGLYQCHLPKMDDVGVVDFNQNRGYVTLTDQSGHYEEYLDHSGASRPRKWYQYYGAVSLVGVGILALSLTLSIAGWAVMLLLAIVVGLAAVTSVAHWAAENNE